MESAPVCNHNASITKNYTKCTLRTLLNMYRTSKRRMFLREEKKRGRKSCQLHRKLEREYLFLENRLKIDDTILHFLDTDDEISLFSDTHESTDEETNEDTDEDSDEDSDEDTKEDTKEDSDEDTPEHTKN